MSLERNESAYLATEGTYRLIKKSSEKLQEGSVAFVNNIKTDVIDCFNDVKTECTPQVSAVDTFKYVSEVLSTWVHIPYFPGFHSPGWLLRYLVGPYNSEWLDGITADFGAGITVGLVLIPQVISYTIYYPIYI